MLEESYWCNPYEKYLSIILEYFFVVISFINSEAIYSKSKMSYLF